MSTVKTVKYQVGTDGTASNNFTIYQPDTPDGTLRIGNGNAGSATDVAKVDSNGFKFTSSIQIGTDATSSNNFTIYQPSTPDGTLRIGVGNADSPTEVGRFTSAGYKPATAPAFSAYANSNLAITGGVFTKIFIDFEYFFKDFDTNSNFDSTTNYRFTPTVSGYYQVNGAIAGNNSGAGYFFACIYKNGSRFKDGANFPISATYGPTSICTALIYLNGSTDYIELYGIAQNNNSIGGVSVATFFQAFLAQQA